MCEGSSSEITSNARKLNYREMRESEHRSSIRPPISASFPQIILRIRIQKPVNQVESN